MEILQYWMITILTYPGIQTAPYGIWFNHHYKTKLTLNMICKIQYINHESIYRIGSASLHRVVIISADVAAVIACVMRIALTFTFNAKRARSSAKRVDPSPIQTLVLRCERRVRSGHSHAARVLQSAVATRFPHGAIRATHRTHADVSLASSRSIIDSVW